MKASYFEQLYQADPPVDGLDVRGVTIPIADPPIKKELKRTMENETGKGKTETRCGIGTTDWKR